MLFRSKAQSLAPGRFISTRHSSNQGFILRYSGTASYEAVIATSAGTVVLNSGAVSGYEIKEVVATWEGTTAKLYIDGLEVDSTALAGTMTTSTSLKIGASETTANFFQTGIVYDVRIFDSALSPAAVSTLYDNAADGSEFAAYMGDGTANSNWVDTSGNGYNGTVFGTPAAYTGQPFDGFVSTWYDQSGNANDAVQATTTAQPKIVDAGLLVTDRDGKVALNGKGAKLDLPTNAPMLSTDGTYSLFAVVDFDDQRNGNDTFNNILRFESTTAGGAASARKPLVYLTQTEGVLLASGPSYNSGSAVYTLAETLSVQLLTNIANPAFSTGNNTLYADGALVGSTNDATSVNTDNLLASSSQIFDNQETTVTHFLSEVIYYPSDQSSNRAGIEANINDSYSIY